jgi:predicted membrane GTPase involved in stress response
VFSAREKHAIQINSARNQTAPFAEQILKKMQHLRSRQIDYPLKLQALYLSSQHYLHDVNVNRIADQKTDGEFPLRKQNFKAVYRVSKIDTSYDH